MPDEHSNMLFMVGDHMYNYRIRYRYTECFICMRIADTHVHIDGLVGVFRLNSYLSWHYARGVLDQRTRAVTISYMASDEFYMKCCTLFDMERKIKDLDRNRCLILDTIFPKRNMNFE